MIKGTRKIKLTKGLSAIVDATDFEFVSQLKWHAGHGRNGVMYADCKGISTLDGKRYVTLMHRFILGITDPKIHVDHIDHDGLNNRRCNLRACTHAQNQANARKHSDGSSQYRGVSLDKKTGRWTARARRIWLGCFAKEEDAARAYDVALVEQFGEFARTNFPRQAQP
jgi:hypothetical protein